MSFPPRWRSTTVVWLPMYPAPPVARMCLPFDSIFILLLLTAAHHVNGSEPTTFRSQDNLQIRLMRTFAWNFEDNLQEVRLMRTFILELRTI
ncbi:hypothetical protein AAMO2058_000655100 [Amorphochlora amoebiformis]